MQEAAAGGGQIHFMSASAFGYPITMPGRIREILAQNTDAGRTSCSEGDRPGEPGVLPMILFFLLLLDPSSFLHPRGPGCAVPGDHALCLLRDGHPRSGTALRRDDPAEEAE